MYKLSSLSTNTLKISKDEKLDLEIFYIVRELLYM